MIKHSYKVKVKVGTTDKVVYEKYSAVENKEHMLSTISFLICGIIDAIIERSPHFGFDPQSQIKKLEYISWGMYNTKDKYIKGGRYTELNEGDPPVSFMTNLPRTIDEHLDRYYQAVQEDKQLKMFVGDV